MERDRMIPETLKVSGTKGIVTKVDGKAKFTPSLANGAKQQTRIAEVTVDLPESLDEARAYYGDDNLVSLANRDFATNLGNFLRPKVVELDGSVADNANFQAQAQNLAKEYDPKAKRQVGATAKADQFAWIKTNCKQDEVMAVVTSATSAKDLQAKALTLRQTYEPEYKG